MARSHSKPGGTGDRNHYQPKINKAINYNIYSHASPTHNILTICT